jgi:hypothetical protein
MAVSSASRRDCEVLHALSTERDRVPLAKQIRTTLLVSSQQSLRARDLYARYLALVPEAADRAALSSLVVGTWTPIALGVVHYEACERLELPGTELLAIGHDVEMRLRRSILLNLAVAARNVGVSPITVLMQAPKFWSRTFVGSEVSIERLGPKDARFIIAGFPFAHLVYNRVTFRGILESLLAPFCTRVFVRDAPECAGPAALGWRVAWA